jgi:hypothetical protein
MHNKTCPNGKSLDVSVFASGPAAASFRGVCESFVDTIQTGADGMADGNTEIFFKIADALALGSSK